MEQKSVTVNYLSKDFTSIRRDLINYLKAYFPEQWQDFNVTSPGMAMLELNAYVGDLLSYAIDKKYNELFLDGVSERVSVYRLSKTFGYKPPGVRPAVSIADVVIDVPVTADGPDESYLPIYRSGLKIRGAGQTFETVSEINFRNDFSEDGEENRIIEPILNGNQDIIRYRITKREKIKAGVTKVFKIEISENMAKPFFRVELPDKNVLEIVSVIALNGTGIQRNPSFAEFNDETKKYYEVDSLATNKIFTDGGEKKGIKTGMYKNVDKRFEKEFLSDGSCRITFGGGVDNSSYYEEYITSLTNVSKCPNSNNLDISSILKNKALGTMVIPNTTIYIKYRVGGGSLSNVGSNVLNEVSGIQSESLGTNLNLAQSVLSSTRVNNPIPAIGGLGLPSVDEIKSYIATNYASQNRAVGLDDYIAKAFQMPGKFGSPFRIFGKVEDNKVKMYVLTVDSSGRLIDVSTSVIKSNLENFLAPYKMINDFIEINDGKIINLQIEVDLFVNKTYNASEVKQHAIDSIKKYFDIEKWQMNQNIYISQLIDFLRDIPGVINVVDVRVFNMEGGGYSDTRHHQANFNRVQETGSDGYRTQIAYIDNAIFGNPVSMFEIKYAAKDIKIRVASGVENSPN